MVSFSAAFSAALSPVIFADLRVAFFALFLVTTSGRHLLAELRWLKDPDAVAERVAHAHIRAVGVLDWFLGEVGDAALLERLEKAAGVVRLEDETAEGALGDQLADLRGGSVVLHRRARLLKEDLGAVARHSHRQPAEGSLLDVPALLQPELLDVEVECLVLVEDH